MQITKILQAIDAIDTAKIHSELEIYIAELERELSNRPARITAILNIVSAHYPTDMGKALEAYIIQLEAGQEATSPARSETPSSDFQHPTIWSHQRKVQREQHRRVRAANKQKSY
jgi:hypothetical protein